MDNLGIDLEWGELNKEEEKEDIISVTCPICGYEIALTNYCPNCGHKVDYE